MIEKIDAAAARWPWPARALYGLVKWSLVALGAFGVVGVLAAKWGAWAAAWFLIAPALWGAYLGSRPSPPE